MKKPAISGHPRRLLRRRRAPYVTRHGFGYSVFEHTEDGIRTELTVFVALDATVKFSSLKVSNLSGRPRRLSATGYVEWVLGDLRAKSAMHVTTEIDAGNGALFARNPYNSEFADWVAFFDVDDATRSATGDRTEFLGRNGTLRDPAAMHRTRLSGKAGAGLDPCAAIQVAFDLAEGQERVIVFRLGAARQRRCGRRAGTALSGIRGRARCARGGGPPLAAHACRRAGGNARCGAQRADQRLARISNAWRAVCGRAAAITSRAAPTASATSCRT